jgi:flagellar operon protein
MGIRIINGKVVQYENLQTSEAKMQESKGNSFSEVLKGEISRNDFTISAHAYDRLRERNINLGEGDLKKINGAINSASEKNCKDCLILYKDMALIASVKNRTVITAMDAKKMNDNVITNIDSAVIL